MVWNITECDNKLLKVDIEGRLVAAVAPALREEVLAKMTDGTNVLFNLKGIHLSELIIVQTDITLPF